MEPPIDSPQRYPEEPLQPNAEATFPGEPWDTAQHRHPLSFQPPDTSSTEGLNPPDTVYTEVEGVTFLQPCTVCVERSSDCQSWRGAAVVRRLHGRSMEIINKGGFTASNDFCSAQPPWGCGSAPGSVAFRLKFAFFPFLRTGPIDYVTEQKLHIPLR